MAPTSLVFIPELFESCTIIADIVFAAESVTLRAAWARSLGLVCIELAWLAREEKHSVGYVVELQDFFMKSVLVLEVAIGLIAELKSMTMLMVNTMRNNLRNCFEIEPSMSL
ncbi:hypothetical protein Dsin_014935 [Dipteronia sinensis]|uniref:Uncharacterized protein n=1 Tax=Dipteronia sinensis TaxID=43782 RepID=A0AAE0ANT7_9ROSI|nr:hypothetical protein Dsin_014935 [Dipteronia sinensis]